MALSQKSGNTDHVPGWLLQQHANETTIGKENTQDERRPSSGSINVGKMHMPAAKTHQAHRRLISHDSDDDDFQTIQPLPLRLANRKKQHEHRSKSSPSSQRSQLGGREPAAAGHMPDISNKRKGKRKQNVLAPADNDTVVPIKKERKTDTELVFELEDLSDLDSDHEGTSRSAEADAVSGGGLVVKQETPSLSLEIDYFDSDDSDGTEGGGRKHPPTQRSSSRSLSQPPESADTTLSSAPTSTVIKKEITFELDDLSDWSDNNDTPSSSRQRASFVSEDAQSQDVVVISSPQRPSNRPEPLQEGVGEHNVCPMCYKRFPESIVEIHAYDCQGPSPSSSSTSGPLGIRQRQRLDTGINQPNSSPPPRMSRQPFVFDQPKRKRQTTPTLQSQLPTAYQLQRRTMQTQTRTRQNMLDGIGTEGSSDPTSSGEDLSRCEVCHNWFLRDEIEAHINAELDEMERQEKQHQRPASPSPPSTRPKTATISTIPISDDDDDQDSDESIIDISNETGRTLGGGGGGGGDDDDDGYLSPLEGFQSFEEICQQDPQCQEFLNQTSSHQTPARRSRQQSATSSTSRRSTGRPRRRWNKSNFPGRARGRRKGGKSRGKTSK